MKLSHAYLLVIIPFLFTGCSPLKPVSSIREPSPVTTTEIQASQTSKLTANATLNIPEIKLTGSVPTGCVVSKKSDKQLRAGNIDYTLSCKKNKAESILELSINPTITGGGFGGLDPNGAGEGMTALDSAGSYTQQKITLFGKELTWKPWETKTYEDKKGFYLSGNFYAGSNPLVKYNSKEILIVAYVTDENSTGTISADGKEVLQKLKESISNLKME